MKKRYIFLCVFFLSPIGIRSGFSQSYLSTTADLAIGFYQQIMSPVRQPASSCQFSPSCSQYAKEAVERYGFIVGSMLAADRLMRCGVHASRENYPYESHRFTDPPSKNYLFGGGSLWKLARLNLGRASDSTIRIQPQFRFAYSLYSEREYEYSVIELKRFQSNTENAENKNYANVLIAVNHLSNKAPKKARIAIDNVDRTSLAPVRNQNAFILDYVIADAEEIDAWNASRFNDELRKSGVISPAVLSNMQTYSLVKAENYDKAREISVGSPAIRDGINVVEHSGYRSALLAGIMSAIIPGSGYVYTGRFAEGLSALMFNALLGWGIYSLFTNHNTGSGILLSSISLPFYLGNIVGSSNAALADNAKARELALGNLRHTLELDFFFSIDFLKQCWQ